MREDDRRRLLHTTDNLLDGIEQLRLHGFLQMPEQLQAHVARTAAEIDQRPRSRTPTTLAGVHDYVFRLQGLLLRGGGGRSTTPQAAAAGARSTVPSLSLPTQGHSDTEGAWRENVRLVVQRAHDRARYLHAQAQAAERVPGTEGAALAVRRSAQADDARQNLEWLSAQAERAIGRSTALDPTPTLPTTGRLQLHDVVIDLDTKEVHQAGRAIQLTPSQQACLVALAANQGRVLTREALQHLVNGDEPTLGVRSRTLDVHLSHLRTALGHPAYIETFAGVGFRAVPRPALRATPAGDAQQLREQRRVVRHAWASRNSASPPAPTPPPGRIVERRTER